ncbi:MAG: peptide chain release factor N(5)-glutamine methyltransferase [Chloroflexi bacterium]|nr:MAG: peptide chain release factor N(5)-glutamine methyltransferase [Chloroflexota bacterium]
MTIDDALEYGRFHLPHSPSPLLDARLLLEHVLQVNHAYLIAHGDEVLTAVQETQFHTIINRAQQQEPIPYITGTAAFFDIDLFVTPAVLIPRPETEMLVERVTEWIKERQHASIVDVGTGSGCIPIALARQFPQATISAVDISRDALQIAQKNAAKFSPNRIQFHQGHLLTPISHSVDLITANLPYVTDTEWTLLDDGVKLHEPSLALRGGEDGLDLIRELLQQAVSKLSASGAIFLEIGWQQGPATKELASAVFPTAQIELIRDYAGHDRIVGIALN